MDAPDPTVSHHSCHCILHLSLTLQLRPACSHVYDPLLELSRVQMPTDDKPKQPQVHSDHTCTNTVNAK